MSETNEEFWKRRAGEVFRQLGSAERTAQLATERANKATAECERLRTDLGTARLENRQLKEEIGRLRSPNNIDYGRSSYFEAMQDSYMAEAKRLREENRTLRAAEKWIHIHDLGNESEIERLRNALQAIGYLAGRLRSMPGTKIRERVRLALRAAPKGDE